MHTICFRLGRYNPKQCKTIRRTRREINHALNKRFMYHVYIIWTLPLFFLSGRSCRLLAMQWFWLGFLLFTWLIVFWFAASPLLIQGTWMRPWGSCRRRSLKISKSVKSRRSPRETAMAWSQGSIFNKEKRAVVKDLWYTADDSEGTFKSMSLVL